jgi:hypothetical protein
MGAFIMSSSMPTKDARTKISITKPLASTHTATSSRESARSGIGTLEAAYPVPSPLSWVSRCSVSGVVLGLSALESSAQIVALAITHGYSQ